MPTLPEMMTKALLEPVPYEGLTALREIQSEEPMNSIVLPSARIVRSDTCSRCKHAAPQGQGLECHRNPPMAAFMPGPGGQPVTVSAFPPVPMDGFCGEYSRKIEVA